ncbi:hypothetical protein SNE40_020678 [Patella caerulea]|uniref:Exportin-4 n=1 Tax=Patella caerulea TaxID=87958 RepID=A0AAN8P7K4_PATCE
MADQSMQELEHATQIVLAPPNIVTSEQRHAAEAVILSFRKTKLPYNTCKFILENTKSDYVLFQTATTLKEAIVREWNLLSADDIESLRSFLLRYITKHISLQSYVREQILQTVAVILKRGTLDPKGSGCENMFTDVTSLISSGNVTMQLVACSMLTSLLNEYSSSSRTSNAGFTWEFHNRCKRTFETSNLKKVFLFCLQVLNEIDGQPTPLTREAIAVLNRVLSITEQVLSWEFTPKNLMRRRIGLFETNTYVTLKPNEAWRDTLLDRNILQLFFKIHEKARFNSEMAHHSIQCLGQLASLNGSIFVNDEARTQYLQSFLDGFLHLLASIDLQDFENLGVATTFKNLLMMFPLPCFLALPDTHFQALVDHMTRLTCHMGRLAAMEEALHKDDTIYMEGYEKMLETWMQLISDVKSLPEGALKPQASQIFNSYLQCHISPPDGIRSQNCAEAGVDDEEIDELDQDDRDKFSDQLCCIGALARVIPEHSIPLLAKVLEERVSRLNGQLQRLQQQRESLGSLEASFDTSILNILHEDLHWLILVAAHVLTEEAEGETPMIPADIMAYSISNSKNVDIQTTLKVLSSPGERVDDIPGSQTTDGVVRLISAVFRLCEVETRAVNAQLTDCVSPQVGSSTMWFLKRWVLSYLLPDENYYNQMSMALQSAFGRDTEGAQWTINFLIQKVICNITTWSSEDHLLVDSLKVLVALLKNGSKSVFVVKCNLMWDLARLEASNKPPISLLSPSARRLLLKALIMAGSGFKDTSVKEEFWKIILQSIHDRFYGLLCQENFTKICQSTEVRESVCCLLESLLGIAQGTRVDNMERLFLYLSPFMAENVKLIDVYHEYETIVSLILELLSEVVQRHLCYLGETNSKKLYDICLSAIQMYSKHNTGKRTIDTSEDEENKFHDILIVMELLTNLLSKDFLDFGPPEETPHTNGQVEGADVVMYGLNMLVPLMSAELLKFPSLCSQYFKLLTFLTDIHPEKFTSLPENLFKALVASIEHGLTAFGPDITKMCLEIITSLATHVFESNLTGSVLHTTMSHFLKLVFHMLLLESFDMDLIETASTALFCLICCHQDQYRELVNQLLQSQIEEQYKQRLLVAFNNLTPPTLTMTINRQSKIAFMQNFDQFLVNVRGFLCIK